MYSKSTVCTGKNGNFLNEYTSESEALHHINYLKNGSVPYHCSKCGHWHISPRSRITVSKICNLCTDSSGKHKQAYATKVDAIKRADLIFKEQKVDLEVYKCPYDNGWHLRSKHKQVRALKFSIKKSK